MASSANKPKLPKVSMEKEAPSSHERASSRQDPLCPAMRMFLPPPANRNGKLPLLLTYPIAASALQKKKSREVTLFPKGGRAMPLVTKTSPAAQTALFYITGGTLVL